MGKNLIQQARGKGGPTYRSPSFRFAGKISFKPLSIDNTTVQGKIIDLIKCPGHSSPLAEIKYQDGSKALMPAPEGIAVGDEVSAGPDAQIDSGNVRAIKDIPEGTLINNIESRPGDGGTFCRAGGTFAKVIERRNNGVLVMLPSKKTRLFLNECRAAVGILAGGGRTEKPFLKAGTKMHLKRAKNKLYPRVSGTSQNAVDHPFGGSRSSKKGIPTTTPRNAPPGRKVGLLRARFTGRGGKGKK